MCTKISLEWSIPLEDVIDWPAQKKLLYAQCLASQNRFEAAQKDAMRQAAEPDITGVDDLDFERFETEYGFTPDEFDVPDHAFENPDYDASDVPRPSGDESETPENWQGEKPEPPDEAEDALSQHEADHLDPDEFHPDVARHDHMVKVNN